MTGFSMGVQAIRAPADGGYKIGGIPSGGLPAVNQSGEYRGTMTVTGTASIGTQGNGTQA